MAKNNSIKPETEEKELVESDVALPEFSITRINPDVIKNAKSIDEIASVEKMTPLGVNKTNGENFTIVAVKFGFNTYEGKENENVYMQAINEQTKEDCILVSSSDLIVRQLKRVDSLRAFPVRGYFAQNEDKRNRWELLAPREMGNTPF